MCFFSFRFSSCFGCRVAFADPQAFPTTRVCLVRPGHNPGTLPAALSLPAAVQPCLEVSLFAGGLLGGFPRPGRSGHSHCGESLPVVAVFGPAQACGRQTPEAAVPLPAGCPRAAATLRQILGTRLTLLLPAEGGEAQGLSLTSRGKTRPSPTP